MQFYKWILMMKNKLSILSGAIIMAALLLFGCNNDNAWMVEMNKKLN